MPVENWLVEWFFCKLLGQLQGGHRMADPTAAAAVRLEPSE